MIKNNLSVLLAERGLTAIKVSEETGIARSTLSSLTQNNSKMIQIETINTLCKFLKITPADFFDYTPIEVLFDLDILPVEIQPNQRFFFDLDGTIEFTRYDEGIGRLHYTGTVKYEKDFFYDQTREEIFSRKVSFNPTTDPSIFFDQLSVSFQSLIEENFSSFVYDRIYELEPKYEIPNPIASVGTPDFRYHKSEAHR
ncbi:helix-turn-helix domain-containing protein [Lapidilactobacillus achengensis]|uniref:Helix-turn-helix domain-containing protein n=1 Tax=Lapidilactobacillus achengensis TaxID=2486000 RepID=A0ABW1UMH0_9LACO|nr:helix-turn-helix transcriptional regulator [Lapidilactobacillus achengensis]